MVFTSGCFHLVEYFYIYLLYRNVPRGAVSDGTPSGVKCLFHSHLRCRQHSGKRVDLLSVYSLSNGRQLTFTDTTKQPVLEG